MFPVSNNNNEQRNRRRGRNDPNNRDYICPCGKSYLSYPALFTHIKTKHNGRAPGQIIKPTPRRGRAKVKEVYDSESDTDDIASNSLDRLCDFVTSLQSDVHQDVSKFKQIYTKDDFYELYVNFNQQEQQSKYKYNEMDDIYQETCANVLCQFMAEVNKRLNEPYYVDSLFLFAVMMARGISVINDEIIDIKEEPVQSIVQCVNDLLIKTLPKFKEEEKLQGILIFQQKNMAKLLELFFNWLTQKKYLAVRVKINEKFFS